jgi:serine/threonine-protein kinase
VTDQDPQDPAARDDSNAVPERDRLATGRWERVRQLFDAAVALPPEARAAFLARESAGDASLAEEVRGLLAADERAAERLGHAVRDAAAVAVAAVDAAQSPMEGRRLGPWRLVRELGHGGMGAVYLAERVDGAFTQQVALKVIRRGFENATLHDRFNAERRILARLEHPSIARLVDGGVTADGQPWYAMELVEGDPIDRYCASQALDLDARLKLFTKVCRAVMFAHSCLVVHRDLKPDHILVTRHGEVRLLDFGIAKLLDDSDDGAAQTRTGMRLMTPGYASPEQVRGERVGTTSDIYSLGVILYELLTGERPYDLQGKSVVEVERIVSQIEPERPSTRVSETGRLRRALRGDLDVICLKALRKEPERRYGSVEALLEDITRHLEGRPVLARPDTVGYRLRKFVQRNRIGVGVGAAASVLLVVTTGIYLQSLASERDVARAEAARATEVSAFLRGLFEVSDPSESRGTTITARELLDAGAARVATDLAGQPDVQATMMRVIAEVYNSIGLPEQARPLAEGALARHRQLHGDRHAETTRSMLALAAVLQDQGEFTPAGTLFREAHTTLLAMHGTPHADVSEAARHLAFWEETNGDEEAAERLFKDALAQDRALFPPEDRRVVDAIVRLAGLQRRMGKRQEAEPLLREGLAAQRRIHGDTHPDVASTMRNLGSLLRDEDRAVEAESLYVGTIAILRALHGNVHPEVVVALNSYAILLSNRGDISGSIRAYEEILEMADSVYGGPHPNTVAVMNNLAQAYRDAERYADAEAMYGRTRRTMLAVLPADHPNHARVWQGYGNLYRAQERWREAHQAFQRALAIRRAALPRGHRLIAETLYSLLVTEEDLGDTAAVARRRAELAAEEAAGESATTTR